MDRPANRSPERQFSLGFRSQGASAADNQLAVGNCHYQLRRQRGQGTIDDEEVAVKDPQLLQIMAGSPEKEGRFRMVDEAVVETDAALAIVGSRGGEARRFETDGRCC